MSLYGNHQDSNGCMWVMKLRILFLSILAVCLLNVAGYFPVFKLKQWLIHHRVEALIEHTFSDKHLHQISITSENQHELKWEREGKEFWYKGKLYDIVRSEKKDGVIHYYCIDDTAETHLHHQLVESIKKQTNGTDSESTSINDFFKKILKVYFQPTHSGDEHVVWILAIKKRKSPIPFLKNYESILYEGIDPPPKLFI